MKIRITRSTVVNRTDVYVGDIVETDNIQGMLLINLGKAVLHDGESVIEPEPAPAPPADPEGISTKRKYQRRKGK